MNSLEQIFLKYEPVIGIEIHAQLKTNSKAYCGDKNEFGFQCSHELNQLNNISQEVFSRIFKPLYIPLLAIVSALLLIKSKN